MCPPSPKGTIQRSGERLAVRARRSQASVSWRHARAPGPPQGIQAMKQGIHPKYVDTKVTCGCGNSFVTRSTRSELKVDICSACHPFFTGKLKYVDTAGRIERFQSKFAAVGYSSVKRGKKKAAEPQPKAEAQ